MAWWKPAWTLMDDTLRGLSKSAKARLRFIRQLRAILVLGLIITYTAAVGAIVWPEQMRWFVAAMGVGLSISLMFWYVIVNMPLQAKSVVRLIDQGYPANVKELAIRAAARKLHEESIETEELLVETAWNETKKAYRKYMARADSLRDELDEEEAPSRPEAGKP